VDEKLRKHFACPPILDHAVTRKTRPHLSRHEHEPALAENGCGLTTTTDLQSGAGSRIRTDDLLITNQLLYQLSYAGAARYESRFSELIKSSS
jgi:hypothetical protein